MALWARQSLRTLLRPRVSSSPHYAYVLSFLTNTPGFNCTEAENATALATLRKRAWIALRAKIDEQTADQSFLAKLRTYFEERFRYDEKGVPRVWTPSDEIDGAFSKAKDEVSDLRSLHAGHGS